MSFNFIEADATELTALDATIETGLNISGIFIGATEEVAFIIGNTGSAIADFTITTSGLNATINDDVEYSIDNETWAATVTIAGVAPNDLTQRIRCRYTPAEGEILGVGSFLIRVDEI